MNEPTRATIPAAHPIARLADTEAVKRAHELLASLRATTLTGDTARLAWRLANVLGEISKAASGARE